MTALAPLDLGIFVVAVFLGGYVQGVIGFALGIVVMAATTVFGVLPVPLSAAIVSLLAFVNVGVALRGHLGDIDKSMLLRLSAGQVPAIFLGVWLLGVLDRTAQAAVEALFGAFICLGSVSMALQPRTLAQPSAGWRTVAAGFAGGVSGGLFAASGPVTGWFCYRQPIPVAVIRATLLAGYTVTTVTRTAIVGAGGGLGRDVWMLFLAALPAVALGTWAARRVPPAAGEMAVRRFAFSLLVVTGIWIMVSAVLG